MSSPQVSVLMTAYNREKYIAEAIESVLAQTLKDFELLIVDDGSKDQTVEIARRYTSDPRVLLHLNEKNLGDYPNRNRAAGLARGRYLKYVDSDDLIYPHGLEVMVRAMERFPDSAFGLCKPDYYINREPYPLQLSPAESYRWDFLRTGLFGNAPASAIIRRNAFQAIGGFSGKRYVGDLELWLRLAARYPVVILPPGLTWWRSHAEQEIKYGGERSDDVNMYYSVALEALNSAACPLSSEERAEAVRRLKRDHARRILRMIAAGQPGAALRIFRGSSLTPTDVVRAFSAAGKETAQPSRGATLGGTINHLVKVQRATIHYTLAGGKKARSKDASIRTALEWLCEAQDVTGCSGFARAYSLRKGWDLPYPETTGYTIPTLLAWDRRFPNLQLRARAERAGLWLASVQFDSGAICSKQYHPGNTTPSIFNTGMVLHGWVSLLELSPSERIRDAARKAVNWILDQQEPDGCWIKASFNGIPHSYYTMVDWALLRYSALARDDRARAAAGKNLDWALRQQQTNGWFDRSWFDFGDIVTTHTLSYTTQGLVESGRLVGDKKYVEAAERASTPLLRHFKITGKLAGAFDDHWHPTARWECCTGNAQTSLVWQALGQITRDRKWIDAATKLNQRLLKYQKVNCRVPGINGAIPGSWPINGGYDWLAFPNHAAKFHIDALSGESEKPELKAEN